MKNGLLIRLFNTKNEVNSAKINVYSYEFEIDFNSFEVKTFVYAEGKLTATDMLGNGITEAAVE